MNKICSKQDCHLAGIEQNIEKFSFRNDTKKYRNECKNCFKKKSNTYYYENKEKLLSKAKIYRKTNKNKITKRKKIYQDARKEDKQNYDKQYYQNNKEQIKQRIYNKLLWDDNDSYTWTWQVDHIIPHSTFKYTSMKDEEFKKCWALENLRPYSAKQNLLDGNRRY